MTMLRKIAGTGAAALGLALMTWAPAGAAGYPPPTTLAPAPRVVVVIPTLKTNTILPTASSAPVTLACTKACSGKMELVLKETVKVKVGKKTETKVESIVLGQSSFKVAKGKTSTLNLALTSSGKSIKKPTTVSLVETLAGGKTVTKSITFK